MGNSFCVEQVSLNYLAFNGLVFVTNIPWESVCCETESRLQTAFKQGCFIIWLREEIHKYLLLLLLYHLVLCLFIISSFQVFSSSRRDSGGGIYRAGSSSLSLLPYFDMADLASSGPYIVSTLTIL